MYKKLIVFAVILAMSLCLLPGCSAGSSNQEDKTYDDEFISAVEDGLNSRWDAQSADSASGKDTTESVMQGYIQKELDAIEGFQDKKFKDSELKELALSYINVSKKMKDNAKYFASTDFDSLEKWIKLYDERTTILLKLKEDYGLEITGDNKATFEDLVSNGKVAQEEKDTKQALEKIGKETEIKIANDGYGFHTYSGKFKNTTETDFSSVNYIINVYNKDKERVDTIYLNADNWKAGETVTLEGTTDKKGDSFEIELDSFYVED